jgi:hypothetical protein
VRSRLANTPGSHLPINEALAQLAKPAEKRGSNGGQSPNKPEEEAGEPQDEPQDEPEAEVVLAEETDDEGPKTDGEVKTITTDYSAEEEEEGHNEGTGWPRGFMYGAEEAAQDAEHHDWSRYEVDAEMVAAASKCQSKNRRARYRPMFRYPQTD